MQSPEGQAVILDTDFEQLFDKVISIIATVLSKATMILEDKLIIGNALSLVVGMLLYKRELYARFIAFSGA